MKPDKAPAYWPTRILLAVGIISTALVVAGALWLAFWGPWMSNSRPILWGLPSNVVINSLGAAVAVIGLIWLIRIFRGPRDKPPKWRYAAAEPGSNMRFAHPRRRGTPGWWLSRFELAVAIGVVAVSALAVSQSGQPCFGCVKMVDIGPFWVAPKVATAMAALVIAVIGLIWMMRILRGPRDEPPRWRYRNH